MQRRIAAFLGRAGLRPGDRVVLLTANHPLVPHVSLACLRAGHVPVPLNVNLHPDALASFADDADPAFVIADTARGPLAARTGRPWADLADPALLAPGDSDLAAWPLGRPMHYTSGTTGQSKGVYGGVLSPADGRALWEDEIATWDLRGDDVHLVCSPLYHSAPLRFAMAALLAGGRLEVLPSFDADAVLQAIASARATTTFMAPTQLRRILERADGVDVSSIRLLAHAGAPCPTPVKERALTVFPVGSVWEFYGATEGQFTQLSPDEWRARPHSVGRARSGRRLAVLDDSGQPTPPGELGTIYCAPPPGARFEYWRDPQKTAAAWRGEYFTVGDMGALDEDGYLRLAGRGADLIISGGVNVYPAEVERVLLSHPAVTDGVVFGAADAEWGERVCAAVVIRAGGPGPEELRAWLRERLAGFQTPKEIVVVDELPRTGTGKVRRVGLAAALGLQSPSGLDTIR